MVGRVPSVTAPPDSLQHAGLHTSKPCQGGGLRVQPGRKVAWSETEAF